MTAFILAWPLAAGAQEIVVQQFCRMIPTYHAPPGVAYTPGVDAEGKPVVPADLNNPVNAAIYPIEIPVELDILQMMSLDVPDVVNQAGLMQTQVAHITVHEDGRVDYNGQDVTDRTYILCQGDGKPRPLEPPPPEARAPE